MQNKIEVSLMSHELLGDALENHGKWHILKLLLEVEDISELLLKTVQRCQMLRLTLR